MSKPIINDFNSSTGETVEREMTDYEYEQFLLVQKRDADKAAAEKKAVADKAALLAKLGITAEEAATLLG
jgi:hypothetical protein